ncbi:DUF2281 domain-containing protein [Synechococcus moorigangaii CMS01]|nr:DUF2281 domain-containing protein [Synechococcus moorigangaii CMS01]
MILTEQIQENIRDLPEEAKSLLLEYIQTLREKYALDKKNTEKSLYEQFQENGLIGCFEDDPQLSTNYKQVLTESLEQKYGYR